MFLICFTSNFNNFFCLFSRIFDFEPIISDLEAESMIKLDVYQKIKMAVFSFIEKNGFISGKTQIQFGK